MQSPKKFSSFIPAVWQPIFHSIIIDLFITTKEVFSKAISRS